MRDKMTSFKTCPTLGRQLIGITVCIYSPEPVLDRLNHGISCQRNMSHPMSHRSLISSDTINKSLMDYSGPSIISV